MRAVLIEKKSGAEFCSPTCTDYEREMFISSFNNDEFKSKYGEPDVQYTPDYAKERALSLRKVAYKAESDPLYMEWQYDKTDEAEQKWRDKVAEIKERLPLPTE